MTISKNYSIQSSKPINHSLFLETKEVLREPDEIFLLNVRNSYPGLDHDELTLNPAFGTGKQHAYFFPGVAVEITRTILKNPLTAVFNYDKATIVLSYLIDGEQIISADDEAASCVLETMDTYWGYFQKARGTIHFPPGQNWFEIKFTLSLQFLIKHQLILLAEYQQIIDMTSYINPEKYSILNEILQDQHMGIFKRIFLESKILELLMLHFDQKQKPLCSSVSYRSNILKQLQEVRCLIQQHPDKHWTIKELASKIGQNENTLKREFKRVFKMTISVYGMEQRIRKAKEFLQFSQDPIYLIAEKVGYKNATHFTCAFRKHTGISPSQFRDQN